MYFTVYLQLFPFRCLNFKRAAVMIAERSLKHFDDLATLINEQIKNNRRCGYMGEYKWTTVFNQAANKKENAVDL